MEEVKTLEQLVEEYCNTKQLSYVERLVITTGYIDGYEAGMNSPKKLDSWISVKERLPDEDVWVLTLQTDGDMIVNCIAFEGQWCSNDHGFIPTVTHWMPLPKPPEE